PLRSLKGGWTAEAGALASGDLAERIPSMSDLHGSVPHFLRVVRGLAKLKGPLPLLAAVTTVVAGVHCGGPNGSVIAGYCQSDSDCVTGDYCDTKTDTCAAPVGLACMSDSDCSDDQRCDLSSGSCVAESGTGGSGGAGGAGTGGTAGAGGQGGAGRGGGAGIGGHGGG